MHFLIKRFFFYIISVFKLFFFYIIVNCCLSLHRHAYLCKWQHTFCKPVRWLVLTGYWTRCAWVATVTPAAAAGAGAGDRRDPIVFNMAASRNLCPTNAKHSYRLLANTDLLSYLAGFAIFPTYITVKYPYFIRVSVAVANTLPIDIVWALNHPRKWC